MKDIENMDTSLSAQELGLIKFMRQLTKAVESNDIAYLSCVNIHDDYSGSVTEMELNKDIRIFSFNSMEEASAKLQKYIDKRA